MGFILPEKNYSEVLSQDCSSLSRNNVCKTDSVFQAAPFGDLKLNEKQKKHYYFVEQQKGRLFIVYSTES